MKRDNVLYVTMVTGYMKHDNVLYVTMVTGYR